jgi:predicted MFS family arabinose efflux permease
MTLPVTANPDFRRLWAAQAVSGFGARITRDGLPMMAVMGLAATPAQLGLLGALGSGPALIVGLAAGGFVDRARKRRVLIAADLARAAVLALLPLAAWLGVLSMLQVYAAAVLVAAASVLFDIADHAYLPVLIDRDQLTDGNARISTTESLAEIGGPALAGVLFQWLTAPIAVGVNALTYLVSALFLAGVRKPEPEPDRSGPTPGWTEDVAAGVGAAWHERRVRPLLLMTASNGFFGSFFLALYVVFALRVLHLTPVMLGVTIAAGGIGAMAGAVFAQPLARALGLGPAIVVSAAVAAAAALLIPLAPADPRLGMSALIAAQLLGDSFAVAGAVLAGSLRQTILPQAVLGRVAATFQAAGGGASVAGALIGGVLGGAVGPRTALLVAAAGLMAAPLIALASPLRRLREMPDGAAP